MRMYAIVTLVLTTFSAACDSSTSPQIAGVGTTIASGGTFSISPSKVQLAVGGSTQLSTNQRSGVEWSSLDRQIAEALPNGVVHALRPGTATIIARLLSDTKRIATATIEVTRSGAP